MYIINIKNIVRLAALFSVIGLALVSTSVIRADDGLQTPDLPPTCGNLQVPAGSKSFLQSVCHRRSGLQMERHELEFCRAGSESIRQRRSLMERVGTHYAGPIWESNSGSTVVGTVRERCTTDSNAIPGLLLQAVSTDGPGLFGA